MNDPSEKRKTFIHGRNQMQGSIGWGKRLHTGAQIIITTKKQQVLKPIIPAELTVGEGTTETLPKLLTLNKCH